MTIVLFLVDTSASMTQKSYLGTSLLDISKGAVETFIKQRGRDPATRGLDRYMLLTFEDPPRNIKAGWKESQTEFSHQLKNLRAEGFTNLGPALGNALHYLNLNRLSSAMDFYGLGRYPFHLEPALIVVITDGGSLTSSAGADTELKVPVNNSVPGSELTKQPFRWDQRIFSLVLRIPGHHPDPALIPPGAIIPTDCSPIEAMCEVTGGRSYSVPSHRVLMQCIESLVQKVQRGAVCCFEKFGADPASLGQEDANSNLAKLENGYLQPPIKLEDMVMNNHISDSNTPVIPDSDKKPEWHETKRMIFVPRSFIRGYAGHWPIPESYWPDLNSSQLPPRDAHPVLKFKCDPCEPTVFNEFPFDKYELEPSPLSQLILERRQPTVCWQVFIQNSGRFEGLGHPFGYLKAATNLSCVNLFIMPYNYPALIPLLHELKEMQRKPDAVWRTKFDKYLKSIPMYYYKPLRKALERLKMASVMPPDIGEHSFSYSVGRTIQQITFKAKEEVENLALTVKQQQNIPPPGSEGVPVRPRTPISLAARADLELRNVSKETVLAMKKDLQEFSDLKLFLPPPTSEKASGFMQQKGSAMFENPFDIPRAHLMNQIAKMKVNFHQQLSGNKIPVLPGGLPGEELKLQQAEDLHSMMVSQMGNFEPYKQRFDRHKLRPLEEPTKRVHAFGNPYKVDKKMQIDEIGEFEHSVNASAPGPKAGLKRNLSGGEGSVLRGNRPPKRQAGPLPRNFRIRKRKRTRKDSTGSVIYVSDDELSTISDTESVISNSESIDMDLDFEVKTPEIRNEEEEMKSDDGTVEEEIQPGTSEQVSKTKKTKGTSLPAAELDRRKKQISSSVRTPGKGWMKISSLISTDLTWSQQNILLQHSLVEATRFKRTNFVNLLNLRLSNIKSKT